jgi:hypothetical protein
LFTLNQADVTAEVLGNLGIDKTGNYSK